MLNYGSPSVISDSQHQHHLALAGRTYSPGPAQTYQTRNSGGKEYVFRSPLVILWGVISFCLYIVAITEKDKLILLRILKI